MKNRTYSRTPNCKYFENYNKIYNGTRKLQGKNKATVYETNHGGNKLYNNKELKSNPRNDLNDELLHTNWSIEDPRKLLY